MQGFNLPYQPIPQMLYTGEDLFRGFDPSRAESWAETLDFTIYRHFVAEGRSLHQNPYMGMMQALHDNAIMQATKNFIEGRRIVAIIGDHKLSRDSASYRKIVNLGRRLTRSGFLVCTGGGPGAMEAGHLGASLANSSDADLETALTRLSAQPVVPDLGGIVTPDGNVDSNLAAQACAWFKPSFEIARSIQSPGESLAIPTWQYGHEPPTPFATHIAKYFQNSIREDGLVAIARQGIICTEGKAGTIQEIFQDSAQNYYMLSGGFSPMVLFGVEYWTTTYPVVPLLKQLFTDRFAKYVLATDEVEAVAGFIEQFPA